MNIKTLVSKRARWREKSLFRSVFRSCECACKNWVVCLFLNVLRIFWCEFCWMKGEGLFPYWASCWIIFFPLEFLRIAWPFSDWPAGTLDMSSPFEDKSCCLPPSPWRLRGSQCRGSFKKYNLKKLSSPVKPNSGYFSSEKFGQSALANSLRCATCSLVDASRCSVLFAARVQTPQNQLCEWRRGIGVNILLGELPVSWTGGSAREGNGMSRRKKRTGNRANIFNSCNASQRYMAPSAENKGIQKERNPQPGSDVIRWHIICLRLWFHDVCKR